MVLESGKDLGIGNRDSLALYKCYSPVIARTAADTELSDDIAFLANVINDLPAVPHDGSHFHKTAADEEQVLLFVSNLVKNRVSFKREWGAPSQKNIAKVASEDRN